MGFGGVAFLTLGGLLAGLDWRGPFAIYLVSLPLLPLAARYLREPSMGLRPTPKDRESGTPVGPDGGTARLLALLYLLAVLGMVVFYVVPTQLPFYLGDVFGVGATGSGLAIALLALFQSFAALSYGRVVDRLGYGGVAIVSLSLMGIGYAFVGLAGSVPVALAGLAVGGAGAGLLVPNLGNWVSSGTPEAFRGRVVGGLTAAIFLGQFLSPVVSQPVGSAYGLGVAFVVAAGLAAALAVLAAVAGRGKGYRAGHGGGAGGS